MLLVVGDIPSPQQSVLDAEHVKLLAIFHYVVSGLAALFACLPIIHLVMGLALVFMPHAFGSRNNAPPAAFGWVFVAMASFFIILGWTYAVAVLIAGRFISQRKHFLYCF